MNVIIERKFIERLTLEVWKALSRVDREAVADHLAERLVAHGYQVTDPPELLRCGPSDSPMEVIQWREHRTGMTFSLILGGTFQPGYEDALLDQLRVLYRKVTAECLGTSEGELACDHPEWLELSEEVRVFGSDAPCELRLKPPVKISPFLMATELVQLTLPGLDAFVDLSRFAKGQEACPFL